MQYSSDIVYTAGKNITTTDVLSLVPTHPNNLDLLLENITKMFVQSVIDGYHQLESPVWKRQRQSNVKTLLFSKVMNQSRGLPDLPNKPWTKLFWFIRNKLSVQERLLLFQTRLVIPETLRKNILNRIRLHGGNQGIVKLLSLSRMFCLVATISKEIQNM